MCGADISTGRQRGIVPGSPPRVRSRRDLDVLGFETVGITSACAEQTDSTASNDGADWDHLRVCGADDGFVSGEFVDSGSPPRVRSRHDLPPILADITGITSACAEQTHPVAFGLVPFGDHLRVCGADGVGSSRGLAQLGSPPRVRSRPPPSARTVAMPGITSACAEQTPWQWVGVNGNGDHLRVCGADSSARLMDVIGRGSPPRVRSRLRPFLHSGRALGITSACAEQTL